MLFLHTGIQSVCKDDKVEKVYDLLEKKLWDEPITVSKICCSNAACSVMVCLAANRN